MSDVKYGTEWNGIGESMMHAFKIYDYYES